MSMTVDAAVTQSYLVATGKIPTFTFGQTKYTKILALLNLYQKVWANEPGINWRSLRSTFTVSATVTATDTYAIPATLAQVSTDEGDFIRIYHTDGINETDYTIVPIEMLYNGNKTLNNPGEVVGDAGACSVVGSNLVFSRAFKTTDAQYGGTIKIPGYLAPSTLVNTTDTIAVDNPDWLCFMVAAEYVRNDVTRVGQYPNLIAQAAEAMDSMKENNGSQHETVNRTWTPLGITWR